MVFSQALLGAVASSGAAGAFVATGGVITQYDSGGSTYRVHAFRGTGKFVVASGESNVDWLVIAGGGAGAIGGGGAGGMQTGTGYAVSAGTYTVTVGAGGAGASAANTGASGSNSVALGTTSTAGGGGAGNTTGQNGAAGGSGGGHYGGKQARRQQEENKRAEARAAMISARTGQRAIAQPQIMQSPAADAFGTMANIGSLGMNLLPYMPRRVTNPSTTPEPQRLDLHGDQG